MTAHLRCRLAQAGAFLALVVVGTTMAPAAAFAAPPDVFIKPGTPSQVKPGGTVKMQFTVTSHGNPAPGNNLQVQVSGMTCTGDCSPQEHLEPNATSRPFNVKLTAPNDLRPGEERQVTVTVIARVTGETQTASTVIRVKAPEEAQTVRQISGKVKDQDGKAISGASVAMNDSAGHSYATTTDGSGSYFFTSSDAKPIAPGPITVAAGKTDYSQKKVQVQGQAGRTVNVPLTLTLLVATASPTPSQTETALPSSEATSPTNAVVPPAGTTTSARQTSQDSGGSMLYIIFGALLVAAGVGTIVLIVLRRRNENDAAANAGYPGPGYPGPGYPGAGMPPAPGRYDATQVATPTLAASNAQTMIAPRPMAAASPDAPTMLHQPVPADDEFPDPYGAPPIPQQGGYGSAGAWNNPGGGYGTGAYGTTQHGGYDQARDATGYASGGYQPTQDADTRDTRGYEPTRDARGYEPGRDARGYDPGRDARGYEPGRDAGGYDPGRDAGGYGGQAQRFDEQTSLYRPQSGAGGYGGYNQDQDRGYGSNSASGAVSGPGFAGGSSSASGAASGPGYASGSSSASGAASGPGYGAADDAYRSGGGTYGRDTSGGYGSWGTPASGIDSGSGYAPQSGSTYGQQSDSGGYGSTPGNYGGQPYGGGQHDQGHAYGPDTTRGGYGPDSTTPGYGADAARGGAPGYGSTSYGQPDTYDEPTTRPRGSRRAEWPES